MLTPGSRQLCVAFTNIGDGQWTAGVHYLKNLFAALKVLEPEAQPKIAFLTAEGASADSLTPYIDQLLAIPPAPAWPGFWKRQQIRIEKRLGIWKEPEPPLSVYLRGQNVDVLFAHAQFGPQFKVPLLSWIPDFQHCHLLEMFSPEEIERRDQHFSQIARHADRVVVSSHCARQDLAEFAPWATAKARVVSFVAQVPLEIYEADPTWVCDHYHLPQRFFYLPNQFWKHKNHEAVVKALTLIKASHLEIRVVCTGNTNEYRDPLYFSKLLSAISANGLRDRLIILGMVPQDHVFQLMRQSLAVLQPSLFEGWSTTIEEVKSVGKHVILSDIPVHREQNPPQATYFDPRAPEALVDCLLRLFDEKNPGPDYELETFARDQLPRRTRKFANSFVEILNEVALD